MIKADQILPDLSALWPSLTLDGFSVTPLPQDASNRRYYRIRVHTVAPPRTLILMELAEEPIKSEEVTNLAERPRELPYLSMTSFFRSAAIRVPELVVDRSANGRLYIEDFGDTLLYTVYRTEGETERIERLYRAAIDTLIGIELLPEKKDVIGFMRSFDEALLNWEFEHFIEHTLVADRSIQLSDVELASARRECQSLAARIAKLPFVLCHRDFHSKNLMVLSGDGIGVIDFQDALRGPRLYDLASLVRDAYTPMSEAFERRLVQYYFSKRPLAGGEENLSLVALQRNLKAIGRFFYIYDVKKRATHLPFVPLTLEKALRAVQGVYSPVLSELLSRHREAIVARSLRR